MIILKITCLGSIINISGQFDVNKSKIKFSWDVTKLEQNHINGAVIVIKTCKIIKREIEFHILNFAYMQNIHKFWPKKKKRKIYSKIFFSWICSASPHMQWWFLVNNLVKVRWDNKKRMKRKFEKRFLCKWRRGNVVGVLRIL